MTVNDAVLVVGAITGAVSGIGALWLGIKKHGEASRVSDNETRVEDVAQRVVEWNAILGRVETDNQRLRTDNDGLRTDNDRLRLELQQARSDVSALRKTDQPER